jgi:16S rRNA processing protein RimM
LKQVRLEKGASSCVASVERVWYHDARTILKFAGIDSISAAEEWEGADILVEEGEQVRPAEGEYSHADLIGCRILRENGPEELGVVLGIEEYGGPALLRVESRGGEEVLIPFARSICREIDTDEKLIRVWLPEGL